MEDLVDVAVRTGTLGHVVGHHKLTLEVPADKYGAVLEAVAGVLAQTSPPPAPPAPSWTVEDVKAAAKGIGDRERHIILFLSDPSRTFATLAELTTQLGVQASDWTRELPRLAERRAQRVDPIEVFELDGDVQAYRVAWPTELIEAFRTTAEEVIGLR